ncbi:uncharacterized protein DS421_4g122390 [Arachis hypogaea]|nr:uncharacterized protein DS421_4g122390 [Arachis hypogaea]
MREEGIANCHRAFFCLRRLGSHRRETALQKRETNTKRERERERENNSSLPLHASPPFACSSAAAGDAVTEPLATGNGTVAAGTFS